MSYESVGVDQELNTLGAEDRMPYSASFEAEDFALGVELKRRLKDPQLNLSTLAELCGVDVRTIRWIRNTKRLPGPALVAQIGPWWHLALTRKP